MLVPLGTFQCHSGRLIVADPCLAGRNWRDDTSVILRLANVAIGNWEVLHEWIDDPEASEPLQPRGLIARNVSAPPLKSLIWREISRSLCTDIGQIGIFDAPFFNNGLAPFERQIREAYLSPQQAWIGEAGANSMCCYDPYRVAATIAEDLRGEIVGVRTTWYSGCIRPRQWTYLVDGSEASLHLDDEGLWTIVGEEYLVRDYLTLEYADEEDIKGVRTAMRIPQEIWAEIETLLRTRGFFDRWGS